MPRRVKNLSFSGRLGQKTPNGEHFADAGKTMNGQGADVPMEVFSSGTTDLNALVMFVVDANKPFFLARDDQ